MVPITANACSSNNSREESGVRRLIIGVFCIIAAGCFGPVCGNVVLEESISPDGKKVASLFERNCGATTNYVQVVIIRESESSFEGNKTEDFIFTMTGQQKIEIQWENANHLVIKRPSNANDIFKELKSWEGIEVSYRNL